MSAETRCEKLLECSAWVLTLSPGFWQDGLFSGEGFKSDASAKFTINLNISILITQFCMEISHQKVDLIEIHFPTVGNWK